METKIKVAGYVRVSTGEQKEGESLTTQRNSIKAFAKAHGYQLTEIYADEGISGGSVKDRHALLRCMYDGQAGRFKILIIHRLSRFGRNARELLDNHHELQQAGIELLSISEGIDFSTKYGQAFLTILAAIAQLERDIIREQMMENRIGKGRRGIPTSGELPYGRKFDKVTGKWSLDEQAQRLIQRSAEDYLKGDVLADIAKQCGMSRNNLYRIFSSRCGDEWTVNFEGEKPITYKVPALLSPDMIQRVKARLEFNRRQTRPDAKREYVLSGFIRCEKCGSSLTGQTQIKKRGEYGYYTHPLNKKCEAFTALSLPMIERAVFETIFENFVDVPAFEKAIAESIPDSKMVRELERKINITDKELKRTLRELDKLVDLALSGTLSKETIHKKELQLIETKQRLVELLRADQEQLRMLPDIDSIQEQAETIRRQLLEQYGGKDRFLEMTYDDKRNLLHWLFDGKDQKGTKYRILINREGQGNDAKIDYFMYGRITGLRTIKGDDINYQEDYKIHNPAINRRQ